MGLILDHFKILRTLGQEYLKNLRKIICNNISRVVSNVGMHV
jgi:hypothetical protein